MSNIQVNLLPSSQRPLLIEFGFYFNLGHWEICTSKKVALKKQENSTACYSELFMSLEELANSSDQYFWKFKSFRNQVQSYLNQSLSAVQQQQFYTCFHSNAKSQFNEYFNHLKQAS